MPADNLEPAKEATPISTRVDNLLPLETAVNGEAQTQENALRAEILEEKTLRLLEEQLVINRSRRKVGEIVVRKEIETKLVQVQVPVRSEKLIIEQVGDETKQIAEIKLNEGEVRGVEELLAAQQTDSVSSSQGIAARGEFLSLNAASNMLKAIAAQRNHGCTKVRIELMVDNPEQQIKYQEMFDRCTQG